MHKIIDQITDHLISLVRSDKPVYSPKELLRAKIPSFLVERIRLYLEDKVKEEVSLNNSTWFDIDAKLVHEAWKDFERTAISFSQIPRDELYNVLQTIVKDIIYVFIEPRKNMAEYIFREDDELGYEELELRCSRLTIYKHFGTAIPLYMKKKSLDTLTRERCEQLIHKLDEKLVDSYTAQDWAQKLEQLFILFGGRVDPKLLATFFEDKGLFNMSKKFKNHTRALTKTDFVYIITNENISDFKEKLIEQNSANNSSKAITQGQPEDSEQSLVESFFGNYDYASVSGDSSLAAQFEESELSDDEMSELLSDIAKDGVVEVEDYGYEASLNKLFSFSGEEIEEDQISETTEEIAAKLKDQHTKDPEENKEFRDNLISILNQAKHSFENISAEDEEIQTDDSEVVEDEIEEGLVSDEMPEEILQDDQHETGAEDDGEEKPMWAQFLSADQMDVMMGSSRAADEEADASNEIEEDFDDPIEQADDDFLETAFISEHELGIDEEDELLTTPALAEMEPVSLEDILESRKDEFIEVIFSGSESKYEKALQKIKKMETWKQTSTYIQRYIFKKYDVDMFSGATVDFTDRLHQYFNEQKNT
jgi:hypothetical protein